VGCSYEAIYPDLKYLTTETLSTGFINSQCLRVSVVQKNDYVCAVIAIVLTFLIHSKAIPNGTSAINPATIEMIV
jgi:hypothetical protein